MNEPGPCLPCPACGNDFIELFGSNDRGWWVGCKPCSKRDGGPEHFKTKTRAAAIKKWNVYASAPKKLHTKAVERADRSPMNPKRWCLTLACGHEIWVTRSQRPKIESHYCEHCASASPGDSHG